MTETSERTIDPNCIAYWGPRLEAAGLPVPKTVLIDVGPDWFELAHLLEGKANAASLRVVEAIATATQQVGLPAFLRTGHTSGKHGWSDTCYLPDAEPETIQRRLSGLVEYSRLASWFGIPYDWFAVREFLPGPVQFFAREFRGMPVREEYRVFVDGSPSGAEIRCSHPYWPVDAFCAATEAERAAVAAISGETPEAVLELAARAGYAIGGAWSVDVLSTDRGWYVTDCALASDSWHWPGCPYGDL